MHALFGEMSDARRPHRRRARAAEQRATALPAKDALAAAAAVAGELDELKKKIVATKEGGAITGEERLREHADTLYGALMS